MQHFKLKIRAIIGICGVGFTLLFLNQCGGGGGVVVIPHQGTPHQGYSVGGWLTGVATGNNITLTNNGTDHLSLTSDGSFTFPLKLENGAAYSLSILTLPTNQVCTHTYGAGTINAADITNISVICGLSPVGSFIPSGNLLTGRYLHTATRLPSGHILVAGGGNGTVSPPLCLQPCSTAIAALASAELYDPASGTWTATGNLPFASYLHTATLLPNGFVLMTGGMYYRPMPISQLVPVSYAQAELYNPAMGTWVPTGSLATPRAGHAATLLPNGKVLVEGGVSYAPSTIALTSAELYDPATGTWSPTGGLATPRAGHTATLLPNGKVLVVGGKSDESTSIPLANAELFDPTAGTWAPTGGLTTARTAHTATLLPNGKVLVAGGTTNGVSELYDPTTGVWTPTGSLATARTYHTATLLPSGKVLVAGGSAGGIALASTELYAPLTGLWAVTGNLASRIGHTATLLTNGKLIVAGGTTTMGGASSAALATTELYW